MKEIIKENMIKLPDVKPELQKPLGKDKIFRFECDIQYNKIRIGLKEINVYTPYYYETFYTLDELQKKNKIFNACKDLEEVKGHLLLLFSKETTLLKSLEDDKKIQICLKIMDISRIIDDSFILDRNTIDEKDEALMDLFNIQKENIKLFESIKKICEDEKYKDEKVAGKVLELLMN